MFFVVFLALVILGAAVRMVSKRRFKDRFALAVTGRIANLLVVMGFLGLWYWFVSTQQIPFLSGRFWLLAWVIGIIAWAIGIWHYAFKKVPKERERLNMKREQMKYFNT